MSELTDNDIAELRNNLFHAANGEFATDERMRRHIEREARHGLRALEAERDEANAALAELTKVLTQVVPHLRNTFEQTGFEEDMGILYLAEDAIDNLPASAKARMERDKLKDAVCEEAEKAFDDLTNGMADLTALNRALSKLRALTGNTPATAQEDGESE